MDSERRSNQSSSKITSRYGYVAILPEYLSATSKAQYHGIFGNLHFPTRCRNFHIWEKPPNQDGEIYIIPTDQIVFQKKLRSNPKNCRTMNEKLKSASEMSQAEALDSLKWQMEMGAIEAVSETPVDRFSLTPEAPPRDIPQAIPEALSTLPRSLAENCHTLDDLYQAIHNYQVSPLVAGAQQAVICDGNPKPGS